jgi:hypothetical protein
MSIVGRFYALLQPAQVEKHMRAMKLLQQHPNRWYALADIDDEIAAGPPLYRFGGDYLDELYRVATAPYSPWSMRIVGVLHAAVAADGAALPEERITVVDTSSGERLAAPAVAAAVARRLRQHLTEADTTGNGAARAEAHDVVVQLQFEALRLSTAAEALAAVAASHGSSAETGRTGVATATSVALDDVAGRNDTIKAIQDVIDDGSVFFCEAPATSGAAAKAQRRGAVQRAARGGNKEIAGPSAAESAAGGDALDTVEAARDCRIWLLGAPIVVEHQRVVRGVTMVEPSLPAVLTVDEGPIAVSFRRRPEGPGAWPDTSPIGVTILADGPKGDTAAVPFAIDKYSFVLPGRTAETKVWPPAPTVIRITPTDQARLAGNGCMRFKLQDMQRRAVTSTGARSVKVVERFRFTGERRGHVVLYHRGDDASNVLADYGIQERRAAAVPDADDDVEATAAPATASLVVKLSLAEPSPYLTAALQQADAPTAEEAAAADAELFVCVDAELRREEDAAGKGGAAATAGATPQSGKARSFAMRLRNRHMLRYGLDARKAYRPAVDRSRSQLMPIGQQQRKRQRQD